MRYTYYGIGHPTALRKLTRDCANAGLDDSPELDEDENDGNEDWEGDRQPHEGDTEEGHDDEGMEEDEDTDDDQEEDLEQDDGEESSDLDDAEDASDRNDEDEHEHDDDDDYVFF